MAKQSTKTDYDVSIVLNTHREGRAMQPTVRSLARCISHALSHELKVELVVVLDRSDDLTKKYVKGNLPNLIDKAVSIVIREADVGDLGLARNYGLDAAQGEYIGVVDADDLFSENLITESVKALKELNYPVVVHPEYVVSFGDWNEVWHLQSSNNPNFRIEGVVEYNPWSSLSFASKTIRDKYRYKPTIMTEGFGPEDWQWNLDTLGAGIEHIALKNVAYFYRRKNTGSLGAASESMRPLLSKTKILRDQQTYAKINSPRLQLPSRRTTLLLKTLATLKWMLAKTGKYIGPAFRHSRRTQAFEHYMRIALRELFSTTPTTPLATQKAVHLPGWLLREWLAQHEFEHKLFPSKELVKNITEYRGQVSLYSAEYWRLLKKIPLDSEYIFIVPWLKLGGADLVILNYVKAILALKPSSKVTILATENSDSPWKRRLPKEAVFVPLNGDYLKLSSDQQTRLLGVILLQIEPTVVHLVNSALGFKLFTEFSKRLSKVSNLYISAFGVDYQASGQRAHYLLDHLNYSIDYVEKMLTDNNKIVENLVLWQGMPRDKFAVHYQPYNGQKIIPPKTAPRGFSDANPCKVLWAGRLDQSKRPDILLRIAKKSQEKNLPIEFHIYGNQVLSKDNYIEELTKLDNTFYHGGFNRGLKQLPLQRYDLFMMTTQYEGMPNVLIEATGRGLPVMAPAVGGIPEFIQAGKTGYLVPSFNNVGDYIKLLRKFMADPVEGNRFLKNAQQLLKTRHSWETFKSCLIRDGYIEVGKPNQHKGPSTA